MGKNYIFTAISIGSRLLTGLVVFLLLARLWGPVSFGLFSFVFSVSALLILLVDFGFSGYLLREVGADPDSASALIRDAFWAKATLVFPLVIAAFAVLVTLEDDLLPRSLIAPLFLAAISLSFADFFVAPLRALGRYDVETIIVTIANGLHFVLVASAAYVDGSMEAVAWTFLLGRSIYCCAAFLSARRTVKGFNLSRHDAACPLGTFRKVWPYGIDGALTSAWNQLDVVIVRALFGVHAVGHYAAGQKIVQGISALAPVIGNVMIPKLSRLVAQHDKDFRRMARKAAAAMALTGITFSVPLIFLPLGISDILFSGKYPDLAKLLPYFGLILVAKFLAAGAGIVITSLGLQTSRVVAQLVGLATLGILTLTIKPWSLGLVMFLVSYLLSITLVATIYGARWITYRAPGQAR